ncbi:PilN domain-containing protein [Enterobacter mori]
MPAQAWLSALRYQPPVLTVSGYASALPALAAMTDALKQVAGFSFGSAGELQQDSQGAGCSLFSLSAGGRPWSNVCNAG